MPEGDVTLYFEGNTFSTVRLDMSGPFPDVTLDGVADSVTFECVGRVDSILLGILTPNSCLAYRLHATAVPPDPDDIMPDVEPNSSTPTALERFFPFEIEGRIGEIRFNPGVWRDSVDFHDLTSGRIVLRDAAGEQILSWTQQGLANPSDTIPIELFAVEPGPMFIAVESRDENCGFYEGTFSVSGTSSVHPSEDPDRPSLSVQHGVMGLQGVDAGVGVVVELYDVRGEKVAERGGEDLRSLGLPAGPYLYRIMLGGELAAEGRIRIGLP